MALKIFTGAKPFLKVDIKLFGKRDSSLMGFTHANKTGNVQI
jgi:hypothetical protein